MTVTRNDAATALHDVDSARRHSLTLFQYGLAGPYLLLWGVLWIDEIIHQSTRLRVMSALNALPRREMLEFKRLRAITGATDGNLGAHLTTLERAGFVRIVKDFVGRKPRTRVGITAPGRRAFQSHVTCLREILDGDAGGTWTVGNCGMEGMKWHLAGWLTAFFVGNAIYFPLLEERALEQRFGDDYRLYKANVPRWIPSWRSWDVAGN